MEKSNTITKKIIPILRKQTKQFEPTLIETIISEYGKNPFLILIGCLLSLRSRDVVTVHVCRNLFKRGQAPQEILAIPKSQLEKIIFKTGCYRKKAKVLHEVSRVIIEEYRGKVPRSKDKLSKIKGLGPKTVNLVLGLAFDTPAICIDTHVHRISNLLGLIKTKTPTQTEHELEKIVKRENWIEWNNLLVIWGQNICTPGAPKCAECALKNICKFQKHVKLRH